MTIQVGDFVKTDDGCLRGFVRRVGTIPFGGKRTLPAAILDIGGGREEVCTLSELIVLFQVGVEVVLDCRPSEEVI